MLGISDKEGVDEDVNGEKITAVTGTSEEKIKKLGDERRKRMLEDPQYKRDAEAMGVGFAQKRWSSHNKAEPIVTEESQGKIEQGEVTPPPSTIKPASPEIPRTEQPAAPSGPGLGDVHSTLKEQNNLILKLLGFNKQTANNTGGLLGSMNNPSNNTSIVNVTNSPTAYLTNPMSSTDFRSQMFAR
jgi:hypothetical protein